MKIEDRDTYLNLNTPSSVDEYYIPKRTYLEETDETVGPKPYAVLPEEYDVFSELDEKYFTFGVNLQLNFIGKIMTYLRARLILISNEFTNYVVLPKLKVFEDEDGYIIINWTYTHARIYIAISNNQNLEESYLGLVIESANNEFTSQTSVINETNYQEKIDSVLQLIFANLV